MSSYLINSLLLTWTIANRGYLSSHIAPPVLWVISILSGTVDQGPSIFAQGGIVEMVYTRWRSWKSTSTPSESLIEHTIPILVCDRQRGIHQRLVKKHRLKKLGNVGCRDDLCVMLEEAPPLSHLGTVGFIGPSRPINSMVKTATDNITACESLSPPVQRQQNWVFQNYSLPFDSLCATVKPEVAGIRVGSALYGWC